MRKAIAVLLKLVIRIMCFPLIVVISIIDSNIANRILIKRFTLRDWLPHLIIVMLTIALIGGYSNNLFKIDTDKANSILSTIMNFQGVLFATALAITTFLLSIFKPNALKTKYPKQASNIDDTIDDLRIANMIIFLSMFVSTFSWIFISMGYIQNSGILSICLFSLLLWSLIATESIIRGVFVLINID
jgi:hypothetical protein